MITQLVRERGWNMEDVKQVNEVAEVAAEETEVAEEVTVAESQEEAVELKELQLVEGEVVEQIASKEESTDKDGNVRKAKEAKILLNNCEYEKSLKIFCSLLKKPPLQ